MEDSKIHEGHRRRIRERFSQEGLDSFQPHEVLELLLFYGIPRKDANKIAHKLIDTFGSFSAALEAPLDMLEKVDGMTNNAAVLIKTIPEVCRYYLVDKHENECKTITLEQAGNLLMDKFIGRVNETVVLMLLDSKCKLLFCGVVSEGNVNSSQIYIRNIISLAVRYNASKAIIAHNHPSGIALPSKTDLATTSIISDALKLIDVKLIDHIIVADRDYVSLADNQLDEKLFKWY